MIFDTHAHYDDERFDEDREKLLDSMESRGIGTVVNVSASFKSCFQTLSLAGRFPHVYAAIGIHPNEVGELDEEKFQTVREYAMKPKVVAIGEIGLDYYWMEPKAEIQKEWFKRQLDLARELKLPVVIHSRDAAKDTLDILKEKNAGEIGGIIHCFSYSMDMAREFMDLGFYLGIGGVVTFKNSKKLKEVVQKMPLERMVIETDCPYLAPEPVRGTRNSSLNLPYIVNEIAELKGISSPDVINITERNAKDVYGLNTNVKF